MRQMHIVDECGKCGGDDDERLSLVQQTTSGKWLVDETVHVTPVNDDVVQFALHSPIHRSAAAARMPLLCCYRYRLLIQFIHSNRAPKLCKIVFVRTLSNVYQL